jgi:hypothetical protein
MPKIFPYLSEPTARRLRQTALSRSAKHRHIFESAIEAYVTATEEQESPAVAPDIRQRYRVATQAAEAAVRNRRKKGLIKVGTYISTKHHEMLCAIRGPKGQFLSDTVELVLSYFLWREVDFQQGRNNFSAFLWPFIDLPQGLNFGKFVREISEPF